MGFITTFSYMYFILFHPYLPSHYAPSPPLHLLDAHLPSFPLGFSCNICVRMFMCMIHT